MTSKDQCREAFEAWWEEHGQLCRAGGGDYEKTFAFRAWQAARSTPAAPVELPEPAIPGSQGVCCGRFDSGGYYMGQTEQVCCGDPVDAHPAYYTEQQVRDLLSTAHEARREAQHQLETCKTELAKLERYGFMLSRGALVPAGWVAVPVEPTAEMLEAAHESAYVTRALAWREAEIARYAALLAAAPKLPQGNVCWCQTCRPITLNDMRMVLCPECGNKRCPHARRHDNACTGSNEPGQPGSSWGHEQPPQQQGTKGDK